MTMTLLAALLLLPAAAGASDTMDCGDGVGLCGVLTLETGDGPDAYNHDTPGVHGLWPQVDPYGNSLCVAPTDTTDPTVVYECYQTPEDDTVDDAVDQLGFEIHEWEKHGWCAGVVDEADFFTQVCGLADDPLSIMTDVRESGGDLDATTTALEAAGYEVFYQDDDYYQVELSACATPAGVWTLTPVANFSLACGGWNISAYDDDTSEVDSCVPNTHGPACTNDTFCTQFTDCLRCAGSGYCTDVPLVF